MISRVKGLRVDPECFGRERSDAMRRRISTFSGGWLMIFLKQSPMMRDGFCFVFVCNRSMKLSSRRAKLMTFIRLFWASIITSKEGKVNLAFFFISAILTFYTFRVLRTFEGS